MTATISEFAIPARFNTDRRSAIRWLISYAWHYWYLFALMVFGAFSNAALAAVVPVLMGQAFNAILQSPPQVSVLPRIAVLIVLSQVVRAILQFGRNFGAELLGQSVERDIRNELYVSLLGKSMTFHSLQPVGDTMARATNDVREINFLFSPGLNLVIGSGLFLLMPIIVAPRYHPSLVLVPLLFLVGYILALWQYLHELQPITSDVRHAFGRLNSRLAEAIDGIETVKGMAQEEMEVERFGENAGHYKDAFVRQGDVEARFIPLLLLVLAEAAALLQSLVLFRQGLLSVGDVVAYFSLMQLFGFPTFVSLFAYSQISLGIAGAKRILELINRQNDLDQNTQGYRGSTSNIMPTDVGPTDVGPTDVAPTDVALTDVGPTAVGPTAMVKDAHMQGEIEFKDVSFSYENGEPALDHITFKVKAGQTVAIVGQTGSGKTTLVKLVNRTYDVGSGQVLVDGVDVRQWNLEALRRGISMIEQDIFLFSRSIKENIAFGNPNASLEDIRNAARAAQADEFVYGFEADYETVIGERGVTLSGGQRQRLALARAFLTDPPILVLDDSTSAIDSATEDRIQRAIYTAARGRTTLMITHRLSQIRWADLIVVLRKGHLVAMGDHNQLMRTSEAYRRIFHEG